MPGRHVHDERVELAPVDVGQELLERTVQHRAAPHHGLVVVEEEADRHQLQLAANRRHDHPVDHDRLLVDPEQVRDRMAVDVGVEDARALAEARERGRQVGGERRLADPAFAACDGDHARRPVEPDPLRALGNGAAEPRGQRRALVRCHHAELERHALHSGDRCEGRRDLFLEARAERAAGDRERDPDRHIAAFDADVAHHVELDHVALQLRVDHLLHGLQDLFARGLHLAVEAT